MKIIRFICLQPITRHARQLPQGAEFFIKKSSSRVHVDRWLAQGKIHEVTEPMKSPGIAGTGTKNKAATAPDRVAQFVKRGAAAQGAVNDVIASLDGLTAAAIKAAGVKDEVAFKRLPREEQNAFLAQANGQARPEARAAAGRTQELPLEQIVRSSTNREQFDAEKMAELVESVRTHGVMEPIVVRPVKTGRYTVEKVDGMFTIVERRNVFNHPNMMTYEVGKFDGINWEVRAICGTEKCSYPVSLMKSGRDGEAQAHRRGAELARDLELSKPVVISGPYGTQANAEAKIPRFEIVMGERRWRAAQQAQLTTIPAIVRELDDRTALEWQLTENLQREDLRPMDEARGYKQLVELGYSVDEVSAKLHRSPATIYARIKLLALPEVATAAVEQGKLSASHADLLTTVDDADEQAKLATEWMQPRTDTYDGAPLTISVRDAGVAVKEVKRKLDEAKEWESATAKYREEGFKVLTLQQSGRVFHYCNLAAGYVGVNDECDRDPQKRTWKALLTRVGEDGKVIVAHNSWGSNHVRLVYSRKAAEAALVQGGFIKAQPEQVSPAEARRIEEENAKRKAEERRVKERALITDIVRAVEARDANVETWRFLADSLIKLGGVLWHFDDIMQRRGLRTELLRNQDALGREYRKLAATADGKTLRGLTVELMLTLHRQSDGFLADAAKRFGVKPQTSGKGNSKPGKAPSVAKNKPRKLSPERRARLVAELKARWAKRKAGK